MELEEKLKLNSHENERLERENRNLKVGMESVGDKLPDEWDYNVAEETSNVARQIAQLKNRNESLKKENELIRREMASLQEQRNNCKVSFI